MTGRKQKIDKPESCVVVFFFAGRQMQLVFDGVPACPEQQTSEVDTVTRFSGRCPAFTGKKGRRVSRKVVNINQLSIMLARPRDG